jgi:hypothetical protein
MADSDKPFILYRTGLGGFKIVPRNAQGWRQTIVWMLFLAPITGLFAWFASSEPEGTRFYLGLGLYLAAMLVWGIGGMIWMRRRSEVVDFEELLALKRERDAQRSGRRGH